MAPKGLIRLEDLYTQLRITNRLLAAGLKEKMKQQDLIGLLDGTGASVQEIAAIVNTTTSTVKVALHRSRGKAERR